MIKYLALALAGVMVAADQWVKVWAYTYLSERRSVIPGLFYLTYLENSGAAFGIFQGQAFVLAIISIFILAGILAVMFSGKVISRVQIFSLALILAGGVGNMIDRLSRGFVIDYFDFSAIMGFPIFNLADVFVVVGTIALAVHILFFDGKKPEQQADVGEGEGINTDEEG